MGLPLQKKRYYGNIVKKRKKGEKKSKNSTIYNWSMQNNNLESIIKKTLVLIISTSNIYSIIL